MTTDSHASAERVKALVAEFCEAHLNQEYRDCAFHLIDLIRSTPALNLGRSRPEIWAAAVVAVIARMNFPRYSLTEQCIRLQDISDFFQVRNATAGGKASLIAQTLELRVGQEGLSVQRVRELEKFRERIGTVIPVSRSSAGETEMEKALGEIRKIARKAARLQEEEDKRERQSKREEIRRERELLQTERIHEREKTERLRQKAEEAQLNLFDDPSDRDA